MQPTGKAVGLDMGLKYFYSDSFGHTEANPRFYRKGERNLNRLNRRKSKKYKKEDYHSQLTIIRLEKDMLWHI